MEAASIGGGLVFSVEGASEMAMEWLWTSNPM